MDEFCECGSCDPRIRVQRNEAARVFQAVSEQSLAEARACVEVHRRLQSMCNEQAPLLNDTRRTAALLVSHDVFSVAVLRPFERLDCLNRRLHEAMTLTHKAWAAHIHRHQIARRALVLAVSFQSGEPHLVAALGEPTQLALLLTVLWCRACAMV